MVFNELYIITLENKRTCADRDIYLSISLSILNEIFTLFLTTLLYKCENLT